MENDIKDTDIPIELFEPKQQHMNNNQEIKDDKKTQEKIIDYAQLEEWAEMMRQEVEIKDYPSGWFGTNYKCTKGNVILAWIQKYAEQD